MPFTRQTSEPPKNLFGQEIGPKQLQPADNDSCVVLFNVVPWSLVSRHGSLGSGA